jgi:replicative DNA helicase
MQPHEPTESLKVPPHSLEAEQSVLGGLMLENQAWEKIADRVSEEDFYRHDHRIIFRAIEYLSDESQPLDIVTLSEWLGKRDLLEAAGGFAYLGTMAKDTPSAANIRAYADIVRECSVLRQLIDVGTNISESAFSPGEKNSKLLLDDAETAIFEIAERGAKQSGGFQSIKSLLSSTLKRIHELGKSDSNLTGIPSGYPDLDKMTSGFQKGDLIIVAGRPSMGKTTLAINFAESIATKVESDKAVAIFSMEMPAEQLILRMLASTGTISQTNLRTGNVEDLDWINITKAVDTLTKARLFIDDTPALSPTELRARARRLAREHGGLQLIVLDYLQLMQGNGNKSENRTSEISEISRSLKALAKELSVPVIALSQLNRSVEQRPNKRPVMSDLRESGAIEQDADLILFIYRDEVYNPESAEKGKAELIISKQRNGPIGTVNLVFNGLYSHFQSYDGRDYDPDNNNSDQVPNNHKSDTLGTSEPIQNDKNIFETNVQNRPNPTESERRTQKEAMQEANHSVGRNRLSISPPEIAPDMGLPKEDKETE